MALHHKNWHTQLYKSLWVDRITSKAAIANSPYSLVYGKEVVLQANLTIPLLQLAQSIPENDSSPLQQRIDSLLKLEEDTERAKNKF